MLVQVDPVAEAGGLGKATLGIATVPEPSGRCRSRRGSR